jgi:hypothetical protein
MQTNRASKTMIKLNIQNNTVSGINKKQAYIIKKQSKECEIFFFFLKYFLKN